jgi:hypothetical protein
MAKDKPVSITGVAMQDIACIAKTYGNKVVTITEEPNRDFHYRIIYSEDSKMVEDLVYVRGHVQPRLFVLETKTIAEW